MTIEELYQHQQQFKQRLLQGCPAAEFEQLSAFTHALELVIEIQTKSKSGETP
jgi:hypothetical protein